MSSKSPKKAGRPMTAALKKQTAIEYEQTLAINEHKWQEEVSGKEIEIERLVHSIDALNARVAETNDHE